VIGAGPIGCEMAQTFRRFGSEVLLVNRSERFLPKEDPHAANLIRRQFEREGISLYLGWSFVRGSSGPRQKKLVIQRGDQQIELAADAILAGAGRKANVEGLGLEAAGVQYHEQGVVVNDLLQTTNPRIYAAGDIIGKQQFTHAADAMARICVQNALFFGRKRLSRLVVPRCTYTDPELAHAGLSPAEAQEQGIAIDSYRCELAEVDRAVLDGQEEGFAVVHTRRGTGNIVGATIVAAHAGEMIGEIVLAMTRGIPLGALSSVIHCYPTQVEVLKRIADSYQRSRLTPGVAKAFRTWLAWRR
jgi:pyruvate/2-oxoglutarate dehydrogenase complex dihydrolipoamide dehydrogenase (E3) component